jgi:uncharacterized protein YbdZ (MbtH family)
MTLMDSYTDPAASYGVIAAPDGAIAIWSTFVDIPEGWTMIKLPGDYQSCCDFIAAAVAKENQR